MQQDTSTTLNGNVQSTHQHSPVPGVSPQMALGCRHQGLPGTSPRHSRLHADCSARGPLGR